MIGRICYNRRTRSCCCSWQFHFIYTQSLFDVNVRLFYIYIHLYICRAQSFFAFVHLVWSVSWFYSYKWLCMNHIVDNWFIIYNYVFGIQIITQWNYTHFAIFGVFLRTAILKWKENILKITNQSVYVVNFLHCIAYTNKSETMRDINSCFAHAF